MKNQKMDEMLLTEYKNVHQEDLPDLWSRIESEIQSQEIEQTEEAAADISSQMSEVAKKDASKQEADNTIHFGKLGKKRWIKLVGSIAASLLIVVSYVYTNGDIQPLNENDWLDIGGVFENATPTESGATEAYTGDVTEATMAPTEAEGTAAIKDELKKEIAREESSDMIYSFDQLESAEEPIYLKAQGLWYCYDGKGQMDSSIIEGKELLGETIPVEAEYLPPHNLEITVVTFPCRVYADAEDERVVYVEVIETGEVYGFISIE